MIDQVSVKVITLQEAFGICCVDRVRLLVMNIEQSEDSLFKENGKLFENVDFISCEFHPGKSEINTKDFVEEHLSSRFETLGIYRKGEPYNVWVGKRR